MNLKRYENERVRLTDIEGKIWEGVVGDYVLPEDNDSEEEALILDVINGGGPVQFNASEIKLITII